MLYIDIETYSGTSLPDAGVYRYAEDPDFQILMAAWSLDGSPVEVAVGEDAIRKIPGLFDDNVIKVAHNANFERVCLSRLAGMPTGEYLSPEPWLDTMAIAAEHGHPHGLDQLAKWLGTTPKDAAGNRLIRYFCVPNRKGERNLPESDPEGWEAFIRYCAQDVETLIEIAEKIGDFPTEMERRIWIADQHINDRGMAVDLEMARFATAAADENRMLQELELTSISGVLKPGSRNQLLEWLDSQGVKLPNLKAKTVQKALDGDLPAPVRRVLELRQELALVAAKKYGAALNATCSDGRLRGGFRFFGAHTGRWAGRGVQPHNLPREQFDTELETDAAIVDLKMGGSLSAPELNALVRALFVGPLTVADYAAIEARVVAWLADETWALDAFRAGRDIYVETAERMGGLTRFQGKVAVLALGYNGGTASLEAMGAEGDQNTLMGMVRQWRAANQNIVSLWREAGESFQHGGPIGPHVTVEVDGDSRRLRLPSGRAINYHKCRWKHVDKTWPDGTKSRILQASFADPKKPGVRVDTYGGRLVENITQAVARDLLAEALVRLLDEGIVVSGHIHDEIITEDAPVEEVVRLMTTNPPWADGLPIGAEGFSCRRYRKG